MDVSRQPQVVRVSIERQARPGDGSTPEQVAADDLFGVTPHDDFPGIIYETMLYDWSRITMEYDAPIRCDDGSFRPVRRIYARDLDEAGRAELIRNRAEQMRRL